MPVDANIPLAVANPAELQQMAYRNQLAQLQVQQAQQQQQQNNALLGVMKQPGALDDSGMPTPATVGRIMQVNPDAGMKLQNQLAVMEQNKQKAITNSINQRLLGMNIGAKQHDTLVDIATSAQQRYDDLVAQGTPKDEAARIAGSERNQAVSDAQTSGMLTADQSRTLQSPFIPEINRSFITGSQQYKRVLDEQRQARMEATAEKRTDIAETRAERQDNMPASDVGKLAYDYQNGNITKQQYDDAVLNKTKGVDASTTDEMAKMIANNDMPPLSGYALRSASGQRIMARVMELNPNYSAQDYKSQQAALTKFTSGKQGDTIRSLNVAMDHLGVLSQAAGALNNGDVRGFNAFAQKLAQETGSAAPTNFDSAKKLVADEVVKAIVGSGGGVSDREEASKAFDRASSPEQLSGAIQTAQRLMRGQLKGMQRQYEQSTGRKDFEDRFLSPDAKRLDDSGRAPKKIASKAEYDALPSGATFTAPDGSVRRKP